MDYHKKLTEAKVAMVTSAGFFAHVLYDKGMLQMTDDEGMWRGIPVPTAMTDGYHIVVNPKFFFGLTLSEQVFVLCHEVVHLFGMHSRRFKFYHENGFDGEKFSWQIANVAADAVINKMLRDGAFGTMPAGGIDLEHELRVEHGYKLTGLEAWEDVYRLLLKQAKVNGFDPDKHGEGQGEGEEPQIPGADGMTGDVAQPGTAEGKAASEMEMKATLKSAANNAKMQGKLPGNLKSFINEILDPQVPWEDELRQAIFATSTPDAYSWRRTNRRKLVRPGLVLPSRTGVSAGVGVIAIDSSGSVSDRDLTAFLSEAVSILSQVRPSKLYIVWCDAAVDRVDEPEGPEELLDMTRAQGIGGRGGTSFIPPFEWIRDEGVEPDFTIYMTDGYGPFPDESLDPGGATIWLINNERQSPPWGRTIRLVNHHG